MPVPVPAPVPVPVPTPVVPAFELVVEPLVVPLVEPELVPPRPFVVVDDWPALFVVVVVVSLGTHGASGYTIRCCVGCRGA